MSEPFFSAAEYVFPATVAAATSGEISEETVRRFCREGRFPRAGKIGRSWVIPTEDAKFFLANYDRYRSGTCPFVAPPVPPGPVAPACVNETREGE